MRRLGRFEEALTITDEHAPLNAVAVVRLADAPAPEALRAAWRALRGRHPFLRARLVPSERGYAFADGAPEIPLAEMERTGEESWQEKVEDELSTPIDAAAGPLVRCAYLTSPGRERAELVVTFHHAMMDATSATALLGELLEGGGSRGELAPLPPVEERFPDAYQGAGRRGRSALFLARQLTAEVTYRLRTRRLRRPPIHPGGAENRILCLDLDPHETRGLVVAVRRQRLSLMSAIGAAALLAVAQDVYPGEERLLRGLFFADLRPYVRPRPEPHELGAYFAMMPLLVGVEPRRGFWHLARQVHERSYVALKRGDKFAAPLLAPVFMKSLLRSGNDRMAATGISYTGPVRLASSYGKTRLLGLRAFVSNIDLGPELAAQVRLHEGRLLWDFTYLASDFSRDDARGLAGRVLNLLREETT